MTGSCSGGPKRLDLRPPHPALQKQKLGAGQCRLVPCRLPRVLMASSQLAVGGRPPGGFSVLSRLRSGSWGFSPAQSVVQGQALCHPLLASDSGTPARQLAVQGACVSSHIHAHHSLLVRPCFEPYYLLPPCSLLGPKFGDWSSFVRSDATAQVDKGFGRREPAKKKILKPNL